MCSDENNRNFNRGSAGFTLIEVLVVLTILGLMSLLVLQRGPVHSYRADLRAAEDAVIRTVRLARETALSSGQTLLLTLSPADHSLSVSDGGRVMSRTKLPACISFPHSPGSPENRTWYAQMNGGGAVSQNHLDLTCRDLHSRIIFDPLTGMASVHGS